MTDPTDPAVLEYVWNMRTLVMESRTVRRVDVFEGSDALVSYSNEGFFLGKSEGRGGSGDLLL